MSLRPWRVEQCNWPAASVPSEALFRPYPVASSSTSLIPVEVFRVLGITSPLAPSPAESGASAALISTPRAAGDAEWLLSSESALYTQPSDPFEYVYPNPEERGLIKHFLYFLPHIPAALPPERSTELEIFLPSFQAQSFLSIPRGTSQASDSGSLAILSVASVHLAFLHRSSALDRLLVVQPDLAAVSLAQYTKYQTAGTALQQASLALARAGLMIEASQIAQAPANVPLSAHAQRHLDYLSFAANLCVFSCVLAGGIGYRSALDLSHAIAEMKGGPRKSLEDARQSGDARKLRRTRATLENDVIWEVWSAIWSGTSPKPFSEPIESWFFSEEYLEMCRTDINPGSREDWETFGTLIGMSRPIFAFLVRFLHLYAHARGPSSTTSSRASPAPEPYHSQAYALLAEMATIRLKIIFDPVDNIAAGKQAWESGVRVTSLGDVDDSEEREALLERRIRLGDLIWLQTLEIVIHNDLLASSTPDPASHQTIISLVEACGDLPGSLVLGLMWPLIVAGTESCDEADRGRVRRALELMRHVLCCFNLDSAFAQLNQIWALREAPDGNPRATWRDIPRGGEEGGAGNELILF